jgi:hypothetical protein
MAIEFLLNAPQLLLIFYGLTCIATSHGEMLLSVRGAIYSSLHFVPVNGTVALIVGWHYVGFGLFVYLSGGSPPSENRVWLWRLGRWLLRWGGRSVALCCFLAAHNRVSGSSFTWNGFPPHLLAKIIAFIVGFIVSFSFLVAMFQREQVKRDLYDRGCQTLHIWWLPAAYWVPWASFWGVTGFRVMYADPAGLIHSGYCFVYRSFLKNSRWGNRRVRWLTDTAERLVMSEC